MRSIPTHQTTRDVQLTLLSTLACTQNRRLRCHIQRRLVPFPVQLTRVAHHRPQAEQPHQLQRVQKPMQPPLMSQVKKLAPVDTLSVTGTDLICLWAA